MLLFFCLFFLFLFFVATVHSLRNWPWVVNGEWENSFGCGTSCGYPTTGIRRLNIWSLTEFLSRFIIYGDEKRFLLMKLVVLGWPPLARIRSLCLHHYPDFSWHQERVWSGKREGSKWGCCIIHTILRCLSSPSVSALVFSHFISCFFFRGFFYTLTICHLSCLSLPARVMHCNVPLGRSAFLCCRGEQE